MNSFKLTPFWNCTLLRAMTNSLKNQLHILLLYTVYQCLAIVVIRNNYAFVKGEIVFPKLPTHMRASRFFDRNPDKVKYIDLHLSLMNRSMASITSLLHKNPGIFEEKVEETLLPVQIYV